MSAVVDSLGQWPVFALVVAIVMRAGLAWQSELTWPEYRTLHGLRRLLFPLLQRWQPLGYDSFVNAKGGRADAEFLATVDTDVRTVAGWLRNGGGSLHLISSIKIRPSMHGDPLTLAHVVWTHDDGSQTEAYGFANADGTSDWYAHYETSVGDPEGHLTDPQTDGDVRRVVGETLDRNT